MKLNTISKHKREIHPEGKRRVPIQLNVNEFTMPCQKTLERLAEIACQDAVCSHIAALSDIHYKPRNECPTGTAIVTENKIVPQFIDAGLNCGMRMIKTPLSESDLSDSSITHLFETMQKNVPIGARDNRRLSSDEFFEIAKGGAPYAIKKYGLDPEEADFIEFGGNMFAGEVIDNDQIRSSIPSTFRKMSLARFGTLGRGNHFIELQKVDEILDGGLAGQFGIQKDQIVLLMHTGSSALGNLVSHFYAPRRMNSIRALVMFAERLSFYKFSPTAFYKEWIRLIKVLLNKQEFLALEENSEEAVHFLRAMKAAHNFGYASRTYIMELIRKTFSETLGDPGFKLSLLYDMSHVSIFREEHFGRQVWVHRHGATRAFPSNRTNGHPVFSKTGEPVFIPGSMGDPTYLGVGHPENHDTYFSSSHGAGVADDNKKNLAESKDALMEKMNHRKVKLFKKGSKDTSRIDPDRFKDVGTVVNGMVECNIINPVARLIPLAVMKA